MNKSLNYSDILLRHEKSIVNSRSECDITQSLGQFKFSAPVCCSNMKSLLTPEICKIFDSRNWFYIYHRLNGFWDIINFVKLANKTFNITSISIGIKQDDIELLNQIHLEKLKLDYITIDVALSFTDRIIPIINCVRKLFPNAYLIVGNGCTGEWIEFLENLEINCAKINIGISASCRTRQFTGFGCTPINTLIECSQVAKNINLMSDGGLTIENGEVCIGDIAKAIRFGADWLMSGSLFSKCIDSPSIFTGYFGNASKEAKGSKHVEGANINVETNGLTINEMCNLIEDSLKSSISYAGGNSLETLKKVDYMVL